MKYLIVIVIVILILFFLVGCKTTSVEDRYGIDTSAQTLSRSKLLSDIRDCNVIATGITHTTKISKLGMFGSSRTYEVPENHRKTHEGLRTDRRACLKDRGHVFHEKVNPYVTYTKPKGVN